MQYLVNPDLNRPADCAKFAPKDALVLGVKLSVNAVNQLLGLPSSLADE